MHEHISMNRRPAMAAALLLLSVVPMSVHGMQVDSLPPASPDIADTVWMDVKETFTDALLFFSAPGRFSLREWGIAGWTMAGTGMTAVVDDELRRLAAGRGGKVADGIADVGNYYGTWVPAAAISSGLYATGLALDEPGIRRAGRHVLQSALYAAAITGAIKVLVGRHRPQLEDGPYVLEGPSLKDEYNSFPSGHTTLAFAVSSALAAEIDDPWATAGLYGLAAVTALSRMHADRHWGSDVVFGAVIGIVSGYGVEHLHDPAPEETGLIIMPTIDGIALVWRF